MNNEPKTNKTPIAIGGFVLGALTVVFVFLAMKAF